ncbi:AHH domain-containing protein, partial [Legionella sp.]|uniref:AHH domain-containing protein n=1 Tax=Legionella sp. TaxID=459 RepID=UPI003D12F881
EACLKNWFMAKYDPQFEKEIRLSLMEELLFDNAWGALDVEQHLDSDWVMVARDAQGWLQPTDALPLNPQIPSYKRVEGIQVNHQTGNISFFMEPWSPEDEDWERLFTRDDVSEMMVKNLGAAFFSLDPADPNKPYHPFNTMRFAPSGLADSALMDTMLLTDYMLKFMTTGQEVQGIYPFDRQPIENALSHLPDYLCDIIKRYREAEHHGAIHRFWIEAEEINVDTQTDEADNSTSMRLGEMRMVVKKHRMERDIHGELKDVSNEDEGWPIYVLTPAEIISVLEKEKVIPGHAMIFNTESKKVLYWEKNTLIKEHEAKIIPENMTRLYHQPRINGLVTLTSQNTRLLVKLTRDVAKQTKMSHRYSPEFIFAHDLTLHYNEFATYLPEFGRLRELSRLAVMVRMLDSIRVSNNHKINAIIALVNPQVNPEDTETYRHYKKAFDSIHQSVTTQTTQIRSSLADIENQKVQTLDALKREHGFTTKSQQEDLVRSIASEFYEDSSTIEPLVKQFAAGDSRPLAKKLCEKQKKETVESVIRQLQKNIPGPSRQDFYHALVENQATGDKTIARRVFAEQTRATLFGCERLHRSYQSLAFAEQAVPEEDNEGACYWVPASIKHEEKVSTDGLSRYSFFVYGGVNLQSRINTVPGGNGPIGGKLIGADGFKRTPTIPGLQRHHIASHTNPSTRNHEAFALSGLSMQSRKNLIYLPKEASGHPERSIHRGGHTQSYSDTVADRLEKVVEKGKTQGWGQEQYRAETRKVLSEIRQELRAGKVGLNDVMRPNATKW